MKPTLKALAIVVLASLTVSPLSAALPGAEALAKLIIKQYDINSDDTIDSGEWQSGITASFDRMDGNNDGSLQADELDALTKDISEETGDVAAGLIVVLVKQLVMTLDSDGDKLVSRKEYSTLSNDLFTKLDTDKNNSLNLAELSELPVKMIMK